MSPARIPDRWLDYKPVGKRLKGTRFIAFKVPLKPALNGNLPGSDVFGHWELLDTLRRDKQELGLIIDLTFTTRYYKPEDVPEPIQCVKIFTAGHEVPTDATILSFKRAVRRFLRENTDNDTLIGVHCTHGLNRTGYLICRYLIDVDGVNPHKAVKLFNSSRGHSIERQNYLKDLQSGPKRSNEGIEESEQEPVNGSCRHRPVYSEVNAGTREERPSFSQEPSWNQRRSHRPSHPRRGGHGQSAGHSSDGPGLLPAPGGPPLRSFYGGSGRQPSPAFPPARPPSNLYSWDRPAPLQPSYQRQGPPQPSYQRQGPPQPSYQWRGPPQYSRGGRESSFPPYVPPHDSRYSSDAPEMWDDSRRRPQSRHNQRVNHNDYHM